jgi:hypothetical protein
MLSPERSFFLWSQLYRIDIGKAWIGAGHRNALMPKIRVATWETVETASALTLSAFPDLLARPPSQQRAANFFLDSWAHSTAKMTRWSLPFWRPARFPDFLASFTARTVDRW